MKLAVSELVNALEQEFTYTKNVRTQVEAMRPYIYVHNSPSGTFYFDIIQDSTTIYTASFSSSDLYTALDTTDDYAHLFYKLDFGEEVYIDKGTYTLKMRHSGYSYSNTSWIGWVHMHDDPINEYTYSTPGTDNRLPLTFELYEKRFTP